MIAGYLDQWIKDMFLVCENDFSSVYTGYVKRPFVGTHTTGRKIYIRKVKNTNIMTKVSLPTRSHAVFSLPDDIYLIDLSEIENIRAGKDHPAITFNSAYGHVRFVAFSGERLYHKVQQSTSLEQELCNPVQWLGPCPGYLEEYFNMYLCTPIRKRQYQG